MKVKNADGSVDTTPASVAVIQASALSHQSCGKEEKSFSLNVDEISKLSASAQAEAMRNVPMMALLGYIQSKESGGGCHEQIASETREYFKSQSVKYQQWGMVGRAGVIGGFTYLGAKSIIDGIAAAGAVGDTHIGEVNVSGNSTGGAGGMAAGGAGGDVTQSISLGNGSLNNAASGGLNAFGEKPIHGDGNVLEDNDSPNTSIF